MAKRAEGLSDRLLECAMAEFMEMGFQEASLRVIAAKADTTTGSIYTRFRDKESLFHALTDETVEDLIAWYRKGQEEFAVQPEERQDTEVLEYGSEKWIVFLKYLYAHWDVFRLLVRCRDIDCYEKMIDRLIEIEKDYTEHFLALTGNPAEREGRMSPMLLHMLSNAYFSGIFEVVRHNMSWEEALAYVGQIRRFFVCGWADLLGKKP